MTQSANTMSLGEFDDGLLRWGNDLARWPGDAAARARTLLAENGEARALLEEECAFADALVAALVDPAPPSVVTARVRAAFTERRDLGGLSWILNPVSLALGAATALALGVAAALLFPIASAVNPDALLLNALGGGLI